MRLLTAIIFLAVFLICIDASVKDIKGINPYSILKTTESASNKQIQRQYKNMRSKYRKNRAKKKLLKRAYQQILFERQFNTKDQQITLKPIQNNLPVYNIDQNQVYGYKLSQQFDDGKYFQTYFNATQFLQQKMSKSESNKKIATILILFSGFLLKLAPCFLLICLCRNRMASDHLGAEHSFRGRSSKKIGYRPH